MNVEAQSAWFSQDPDCGARGAWVRLARTATIAAMASARSNPTSPEPMPRPPSASGLPSQSATEAPSGRVTV